MRLFPEYPDVNLRSSGAARQSEDVPLTEISKVGFNPVLDRRIVWELHNLPKKKLQLFINQMYMVDHVDLKYAFKTKLSKVENKAHLVMREEEGVRREEDFVPSETTVKKMVQFMLNKKFEALYSARLKLEEKEQQRLKKIREREEKKKKSGMAPQKVEELPDTRGEEQTQLGRAFHHLVSKDGIIEDRVVSQHDLIVEANKPPLSILILGKPRSGKTKVCADLAASLDLVHVSVQNYIQKLLKKIAEYEPPEDLEEGQEPPKFLTDTETAVHQALRAGKGPHDAEVVALLAETIASSEAQTKGFILDLPYYQRQESWYETLERGALGIYPNQFSFIVELAVADNDVKIRANGIRFDPETGEVVSRWERDERRKPKKKKRAEGDGEGEEDEEEEEPDPDDPDAPKKPKILDEDKVLVRARDLNDQIEEELQNYRASEANWHKVIQGLHHHQYVRLGSAGLRPEVVRDTLVARIKGENKLLRPLAIPLEAEGDNKAYLTSGKEEGELPRRWSLWKQTDPVALSKGKVVEGQTEFAASYNDRVFLFESEANQKEFCSKPKQYLQKAPEMPGSFRLLIAGPSGSGKRTVAQQLADKYGWRIADWRQIVDSKIEFMRNQGEEHKPNNPLAEDYGLGLSEEEWTQVLEGKPFDAFNLVPWLYEHLGFACEKKRPPPPALEGEGEGDLTEEQLAAIQAQKQKELEAKKAADKKKKEKQKKKKAKDEDSQAESEEDEEKEEPLDDLPISDIDLKVINEETLEKPFIGGFILIGFPQTAGQVEKLKA